MKINDTVSVINEDLTGVVTSIHGDEVVFKDEHGFTHRYPKGELILVDKSLYEYTVPVQKKEHVKQKSQKNKKKELILDLHFDKLMPVSQVVDGFERLFIQKQKLLETLDFCKKNKIKNLRIIHGIGDGVLQSMVFDVLQSQVGLEFMNSEILHHQSGAVQVTIL